ncbi:MAG: hypothetical protein HN350_19415 [Phycisphaerales bacterium]|nr:hypothetical protein [Phycisphaerales bacterium]
MRSRDIVAVALCALAGILAPSCGTLPQAADRRTTPHADGQQRAVTASRRIVSAYSAVFDSPPRRIPSFKFVDGPITGNGDIGLTLSGAPERQRYWISKNDFWKSGPDFKKCGPSVIGGIDVQIDELKNASYRVEQVLYNPAIKSKFALDDNAVTMDAWVAAGDNVIIIVLKASRKSVSVNLDLWVQDGYGSEISKGRQEGVSWVTRKFNTAELLYPTEAAVAMRCQGAEGRSFTLAPGRSVTIIASVTTNHESVEYHANARKTAAEIDRDGIDRLRGRHAEWWRTFWAKSYVEIEDKLIEKFYYASHYIMACCSRNPKFAPGLYGNWITSNRTAWAGDIHLNYNHEAPYWGLYSSNRLELTEPYDAPLLDYLPAARVNARKYLGKKGAYMPVGIGPKGHSSNFFDSKMMDEIYGRKHGADSYQSLTGQPMFLGQKSNALFASMNMILRYRYTYDKKYARRVYPYLLAVADFWEDYLEYENGRYVINNDSFGEVGPWQKNGWQKGYGDRNPITSLGFLRVFFKAMIEISDDLNADRKRQAAWRHILAHLSDLPTYDDRARGRKRFRACDGGSGSALNRVGLDRIMLHALVFPAPNIGLGSGTAQLKMIRDDMSQWSDGTWLDYGNGFQTIFICAARVGYDPNFLLAKAREKLAADPYRNLVIPAGGGGIETCSGIPGMINEMMLQSHKGAMRVFPVFPRDQKASFYRLRTFGAFLVSSSIKSGNIRYVLIESERGRECRIVNPWPGEKVVVSRTDGTVKMVSGVEIVLKTCAGERLMLACEGFAVKGVAEFMKD